MSGKHWILNSGIKSTGVLFPLCAVVQISFKKVVRKLEVHEVQRFVNGNAKARKRHALLLHVIQGIPSRLEPG